MTQKAFEWHLQSCRRNLNTVGKPTIIPGLPELAGLVGQMAAQWEARTQQRAMQMDTDGDTTAVEETDATAGPTEPSAANASTTAAGGNATAVAATISSSVSDSATAAAQESIVVQAEARPSGDAQEAAVADGAEAGISGKVGADEGPSVDANADPAVPDVVVDAKAADTVAGVSTTPDASSADAVETRRQKKKKKPMK